MWVGDHRRKTCCLRCSAVVTWAGLYALKHPIWTGNCSDRDLVFSFWNPARLMPDELSFDVRCETQSQCLFVLLESYFVGKTAVLLPFSLLSILLRTRSSSLAKPYWNYHCTAYWVWFPCCGMIIINWSVQREQEGWAKCIYVCVCVGT